MEDEGGVLLGVNGVVRDVNRENFPTHWPKNLAKKARKWIIEHVSKGGIPEVKLPSAALCLKHKRFSASEIHQRLRSGRPAIIGIIRKDNVLLDLRTVMKSQLNSLRESLRSLVSL